jgi:virginiamycin B lyase
MLLAVARVGSTQVSFTEYAVPTAGSSPSDIAAGPDGALWFTEPGGNKIGRITLTTTTVPTLSTWGLILLAMLTVAAGTLQLRRYSSR